jgi:hypothetical protein
MTVGGMDCGGGGDMSERGGGDGDERERERQRWAGGHWEKEEKNGSTFITSGSG